MPRNLAELMHKLGPEFAARAARYDRDDLFVAENYADLKKHGVLTAGLPTELGGGGAERTGRYDVNPQSAKRSCCCLPVRGE
jgi:alkylation response protein AidB-like acyl-CoA dehydrogenase